MQNSERKLNILEQEVEKERSLASKLEAERKKQLTRAEGLWNELQNAKKIEIKTIGGYKNSFTSITENQINEFTLFINEELLFFIKKEFSKAHGGEIRGVRKDYLLIQNKELATDYQIIKSARIVEELNIAQILCLTYDLIISEKGCKGPLYNADYTKSNIVNLGYINHPELGFCSIRLERKRHGHTEGVAGTEYRLHFESKNRQYYAGNTFLLSE